MSGFAAQSAPCQVEPPQIAARITIRALAGSARMGEMSIQTRWVRRPGSVWRLILGWACIGWGLLGLILPIIPGIPLLIGGLVLLSTQYHWAHKLMVWMKKKFGRDDVEH